MTATLEASVEADARNDQWVAWEFRSARAALRITRRSFSQALRDRAIRQGVLRAVGSLPSVLAARNPVPPEVESALSALDPAGRVSLRKR